MLLDEFMAHIFRGVGFDEAPVIVTHKGDNYWETRRWRPGEQPTGRLYYCISTVKPGHPRAQILSRKTEDLLKTYVIVLDDVGTKVDASKILLPPSYILETSPGNFQWGFLLAYGSDPAKAASLIQGLADAGLTDEGAKRSDRVVRVPGSVNDKQSVMERNGGAPFMSRLVEAHWDREYTLSQLEVGLEVMSVTPRAALDAARALEEGETDPVFEWLREAGEILAGPNNRGFYDIECPWSASHTDGSLIAGYRPGRPGAFVCLHGHCSNRHTNEFKAWIRGEDPDAVLEVSLADVVEGAGLRELLAQAAPGVAAGLAEQARKHRVEQEARQPSVNREGPQAVRASILGDLIHVASENRYWSIEVGVLLVHKAIDDRLHNRMDRAGLLTYTVTNAAGREVEKNIAPSVWLKGRDDIRRCGKVVHRLGEALIVGGNLNIAPPLPDDLTDVEGEITPWLDVVHYVCSGDLDVIEWVLDWLSMVVGTFKEKPGWHVLLKSKKHGAGKNLMTLPLAAYLKPHHAQDIKAHDIGGRFNTFLEKRLVIADELKTTTRGSATGHDIYSVLKAYTALGTDTITVEAKGMTPYEVANRSAWVITSNEMVPLPIEDSDRRFMVIEAPDELMPEAWYQERGEWILKDAVPDVCIGLGAMAVVGYLQRRWDAMDEIDRRGLRGRAPMTQAKQDLIEGSASGIEGAVKQGIAGTYGDAWNDLMRLEDVTNMLRTGGLLPDSLTGQLSPQRVSLALKQAGAKRMFKGEGVRGEGPPMRLWCVRGGKLEEYEALGHQGARDAYESAKGKRPDTGAKVVSFRKAPQT